MVGHFLTADDIAKRFGVTRAMVQNVLVRDGIEAIARAGRTRLFLEADAAKVKVGLDNRRPYTMPAESDNHELPTVGHVSALGIALACSVDEATIKRAIEQAGIMPDHIDAICNEPMFTVEDGRHIMAIVAGQVKAA